MTSDNFIYKPTTAFWKIQKLIKDGLPKFKEKEQKVFVIQGGQGAGKTIAICMLLIDFFNRNKSEISICSAELSKVKDTVLNDFLKIIKDYNLYNDKHYNKSETIYQKATGWFVEFLGLDKKDVGKGRRRKIIYINEANKITIKQYADISARAEIVIIDYNPDGLFWGHDLINDFNFINLTHEDNEFLPESERNNILAYYTKGYNPDGTIKNEYWANIHSVYCLGQVGSVAGRIYNWKKVTVENYHKLNITPIYCVDWGQVDPFAVVELKYYDGDVYLHEINYSSENEIRQRLTSTELAQIKGNDDEGLISWLFEKWRIPKNSVIVCDSNRPSKVIALRRAGWEYAVAIGAKSKLLDRIGMLSNLNIHYTDTSKNIDFEQQNYRYDEDKFGNKLENPIDANNHTIDSTAYGIQYLFNEGIIKNI